MFKKLSIHSKTELVRAFVDFKPDNLIDETSASPGKKSTFILKDGRVLDVRQFGPPEGSPILFFHSYVWGFRFPKTVISEFEKRGKRLIVVCRPGYAGSTATQAKHSSPQQVAQDMLVVLNRLKIKTCPILALSIGMLYACALAQLAPNRISSLTSAGGCLPMHTRDAVKHMDRNMAAMWLGPRYLPALVPYLARLIQALEDDKPPETLFVNHVSGSPGDVDLLDALLIGRSDARLQGHHAPARESIQIAQNWSNYLPKHDLPMGLVYGDEDMCTPLPIVDDFAKTYFPNAVRRTISGAGRLAMYRSPDVLLDTLETVDAMRGP